MNGPNDEQGLPFCNFCERLYDPYDRHTCEGNNIEPRVRKPVEDEFSPPSEPQGDMISDLYTRRAYPELGLTRQEIGEALDEIRKMDRKFTDEHRIGGYESLETVLLDAYLQAATGKGAARHGRGVRFDEQPTQAISRLLGTDAGLAFQAMKKINEGMRLDHAAKIKELLGAINYIASIIIHMEYDNGR